MRVLIQPRPLAEAQGGGDYLHLEAMTQALRARGVEVDISTDAHADVRAYDLVHIHNSVEPVSALQYYLNARQQHKPVVVMPIYWTLARLWNAAIRAWTNPTDTMALESERVRREMYLARERILLRGANLLLPLSCDEGDRLVSDFHVSRDRLVTTHLGVDEHFAQGNAARFVEQFGVQDFILCVGELARRKNQLNLLRALQDDTRPLVFIGKVAEPAFYAECQAAASQRTNVLFLPKQPPSVLADAYAAARVHALVSWHDIAPMVTLEAAIAGCPQVITTECGMRDYFRDGAFYCDPEDLPGIRSAVDAAWNAPRATELAAAVCARFTWEHMAQQVVEGYNAALACAAPPPSEPNELIHVMESMEGLNLLLRDALAQQARESRGLEEWAHGLEMRVKSQRSVSAAIKNFWSQRRARVE
jgi:glycosyltransferase involved in cell wall biosynthesis